jgi:bifunctional N-acetylglucosamine-1-phosphate-uridyltransferase/glucosamine-1-phosphate-acetyltransferase GlmU-like protein
MSIVYLRETNYHSIVEQHDILARVTGQLVGKFDFNTTAFSSGLDNGMLCKVDFVQESIEAPAGSNADSAATIYLHYSQEKINDSSLVGAKNFFINVPTNAGYAHTMQLSSTGRTRAMGQFGVKPLFYKLNVGDSWTSDAFLFDTNVFTNANVLYAAAANAKTTPMYIVTDATGFGRVVADSTGECVIAQVIEENDLPSGQPALKVVVAG